MNKMDLVKEIESAVGNTKDAKRLMDSIINNITFALKNNEEVRLAGFGTFKISNRKARSAVNPQTGQKINIAEKRVPKFLAHKALKEAVQD